MGSLRREQNGCLLCRCPTAGRHSLMSLVATVSLTWTILLMLSSLCSAANPCSKPILVEEDWRDVSHPQGATTGKCDKDRFQPDKWYRFGIAGQPANIPTNCIKNDMCGATIALRINLMPGQSLPAEVGDNITAVVCGSYNVLGKYDCCVLRSEVIISRCENDVMVYQFSPSLTDRCSVAVCTQKIHEVVPSEATAKMGEAYHQTPDSEDNVTKPSAAEEVTDVPGLTDVTRSTTGDWSGSNTTVTAADEQHTSTTSEDGKEDSSATLPTTTEAYLDETSDDIMVVKRTFGPDPSVEQTTILTQSSEGTTSAKDEDLETSDSTPSSLISQPPAADDDDYNVTGTAASPTDTVPQNTTGSDTSADATTQYSIFFSTADPSEDSSANSSGETAVPSAVPSPPLNLTEQPPEPSSSPSSLSSPPPPSSTPSPDTEAPSTATDEDGDTTSSSVTSPPPSSDERISTSSILVTESSTASHVNSTLDDVPDVTQKKTLPPMTTTEATPESTVDKIFADLTPSTGLADTTTVIKPRVTSTTPSTTTTSPSTTATTTTTTASTTTRTPSSSPLSKTTAASFSSPRTTATTSSDQQEGTSSFPQTTGSADLILIEMVRLVFRGKYDGDIFTIKVYSLLESFLRRATRELRPRTDLTGGFKCPATFCLSQLKTQQPTWIFASNTHHSKSNLTLLRECRPSQNCQYEIAVVDQSVFEKYVHVFATVITLCTICLLILIFGLLFTRCRRRGSYIAREDDMENKVLSDNHPYLGANQSPFTDAQIMGDEVGDDASVTVSAKDGDDENNDNTWVIPLDDAVNHDGCVAKTTEDTKL